MISGVDRAGSATATTARPLETAELSLGGMHCGACAARIESKLADHPAVASASVNLATARAFVAYDPAAARPDDLCEAVVEAGYSAAPVDGDGGNGGGERSDHWVLRAAISWPVALGALLVGLLTPETAPSGWVVLALAAAVEVAGGWPFLRNAVRLLRHGATNMDTLIALGTLAALAVSAVEAIALGGRHVHLGGGGNFAARLHGVMAPLIVAILVTGRAVEERARARAGRAMHSLLGLRPPTARVVAAPDDEEGTLVPPESIPVGALVRVRANETIPLDGTVVEGRSAVDESMLTGEPLPVERGPESCVTGGTRNGTGILVVKVTAIAGESVLAGLQRLVDEAQRDKAPLQRMADRVSSVFVPVVLAASAVTFLAWWLAAGDFGTAVLAAVALLLVACPCAMGLAAPVAMMVGSGRASAMGILVRSGDALERLAGVDTVVFDKTGTLTERFAAVTGTAAVPGTTVAEVLALAAAVEAESDHPIAVAIRAAGVPTARATECVELPGSGVAGIVDGRAVRVVRLDAARLPGLLVAAVSPHQERGETVVVVERDGEVVGAVAVATPVRPEAAAAVRHLHSMGVGTAILSGDSEPAVGAVATDLGIGAARSALSPADKLEALRAMQAGAQRVAMVGDGVNDAPALAAADVGVAIGSGAEAALANSDVALLRSDLEGVPAAIATARSTVAVISQNFGWAMGYNISAIPLAAAGLLDPLVAAIAMGASSLIVVANSLRLTRLGRSGLAGVRPPRATRGLRGVALSIALPIAIFGGATIVGQVVSPARGQSLLPTLTDITDVRLPAGVVAEAYLDSLTSGVNQFHLIFERGGSPAAVGVTTVTASHDGGPPTSLVIRPYRLGDTTVGHFVAFTVLTPGTWRFVVRTAVGHTPADFTVTRTVH